MPADTWLTREQNDMKWGIVERIEQLGYTPEIFTDPTGRKSLSSGLALSAADADEIARHCHGAAIIGLPRWVFKAEDRTVYLPTEYCQYEGAIARTLGLPLLILAQANLMRRVVFDSGFGPYIGTFPEGADRSWLGTNEFQACFTQWRARLENRRDVFLGYCGSSSGPADNLRTFLEHEIGATVLDWKRDFMPGRSILEEIEEARGRCAAGIFLFTKDDTLRKESGRQQAAPRDNVVFEAGYFASAKGKKRVLIVLQKGTKMPADLGGDIYASLEDPADLSSVKETVLRFLSNQ
jgi:hypothetical protein